ncbi:MAG: mechanosensitive ion channel family protein [Burkholderiaceae bacterium]
MNPSQAMSVVVPFLFKLAGAIALWIVGGWLIQVAMRLLRRTFKQSSLDPTVITYLLNILGALLRVVLVVAILATLAIFSRVVDLRRVFGSGA